MLIRRFYVKDIREYEDNNNKNILEIFNHVNFSEIIDLISLGNGKCSEEEAGDLLDKYLEDKDIVDAMIEIRECLIGKSDSNEVNSETDIDLKNYNSLTDLYNLYCMQLMSVGFGYSEFWDLNTKDMYRVFNSIQIKRRNEINQSLNLAHTQAALIGQAVWGKLPREVPQIKSEQEEDKQVADEEDKMIAKLMAFGQSYNMRRGYNGGKS